MKPTHRLMYLFFAGLWLMAGVYAQPVRHQDIIQRVQVLYQEKNYSQALDQLKLLLLQNPFDVSARCWQTYIYLTRDDSVHQSTLPNGLFHADSLKRYNFQLVLENINFLRNATPLTSEEEELIKRTLTEYDNLFGDLQIRVVDPPAVGYYTGWIQLEFKAPFRLTPIQSKRLEEINQYFKFGRLYFNRYDPNTNAFYCQLPGLPKLSSFLARYKVVIPGKADTIRFSFNRRVTAPLQLKSEYLDSLKYELPNNALLLLTDKEVATEFEPEELSQRNFGNEKETLLITSTEKLNRVKFHQHTNFYNKLWIWGGVCLLGTWIYTQAR
ncbi:MAG: hypothetical protein D6813_13215 [Calditrichaeota bacterium]|nr:MAG: hypothetical protein D6813_13215 [Calditrichota bacterium]